LLENYHNPDLVLGRRRVKGTVCWKSPSNIALIKYWGKYNNQLPKNPSLSFSLKECYTQTSLSYQTSNSKPKRKFFFNGEENEKFAQRIWSLLVTFSSFYPFLSQIDIRHKKQLPTLCWYCFLGLGNECIGIVFGRYGAKNFWSKAEGR
jgi:diphosphomevalonate decarboxylase